MEEEKGNQSWRIEKNYKRTERNAIESLRNVKIKNEANE